MTYPIYPVWASFLSAFVLNVIPFGAPPYVIFVAYEARYGGLGLWPPILAAAAGAALAKMIMYVFGIGLRGPLRRNRNVRLLARYSDSRWAYLLAFVSTVVPVVPLDDFVYIAGGASGLRAKLMAAAAVTGKFVKTIVEVTAFIYLSGAISGLTHVPEVYIMLVFVVGGAVAGLATFLADWESWARRLGLRI